MTVTILKGDCREVLQELPDESVHCVVTSPPYWRQRDYRSQGQIGVEDTPDEYVEQLVAIFRAARRVLRKDGICWLNLGDKWASGGHGGGGSYMAERGDAWAHANGQSGWRKPPPGYKDKDLIGLPWMSAFALRADGWFLRDAVTWAKPNMMPGSQHDRCTMSYEMIFQMTRSNDYWSDFDAIKTPPRESTLVRTAQDVQAQAGSHRANGGMKTNGAMKAVGGLTGKPHSQQARPAMMRNVWFVSPGSYEEEHFAVMSDEIARRCILAGCPLGGTVLDPFGGAGTTGVVADRLGRNAILIELNPDYAAMAERRIKNDAGMFAETATKISHEAAE